MKYKNKISINFVPLSKTLSIQIDSLVTKVKSTALDNGSEKHYIAQNRLFNILRTFSNVLLNYKGAYPESIKQLLSEGLNCLEEDNLWLKIEHHLYQAVELNRGKNIKVDASIIQGLEEIAKIFTENKKLNGPCKIPIDETQRLNISKLHLLPFQYVEELQPAFKQHIDSLVNANISAFRILKSNQLLLNNLMNLIQSEYFISSKFSGLPLSNCFSDLDWLKPVKWIWAGEYAVEREAFLNILTPLHWRDKKHIDLDKFWRTRNTIATKFKPISITLSEQVEELFTQSISNNESEGSKSYFASHKRLINSSNSLLEVLNSYGIPYPQIIHRFTEVGFDLLASPPAWRELEYNLVQQFENIDSAEQNAIPIRVYEALETLTKFHFKDGHLKAPWKLHFKKSYIDFTRVYTLPFQYVEKIRPELNKFIKQLNSDKLKCNSIRGSTRAVADDLIDLIESDYYQQSKYNNKPLKKCFSDKAWMMPIIEQWEAKRRFNSKSFLKVVDPEVWGERKIPELKNLDEVWKFAHEISPIFFKEIKSYWANNADQAKYITASLVRVIVAKPDIMQEVIVMLKDKGIAGLADNNYAGFKIIRNTKNKLIKQKGSSRFNNIHIVAENLYQWVTKKTLPPFYWHEHRLIYSENFSQDISFLYNNYPKVYEEVIELHQTYMTRNDSEQKSQITVYGWIASLQTLLKSYNALTDEQNSTFASEGFKSLSANKFELLNTLRLGIQDYTKSGTIELEYGENLQASLDKFLEFQGLAKSQAYKIHTSLRDKHAVQKANSDKNLYTMKEIVEIAYYIEVALSNFQLTIKQKVELMLIKIQLKSGWNISYLSKIELDDVVEFDTPLAHSTTKAIRIFKKRANYSSQWHKYEISPEDLENEGVLVGSDVMPVWKDIQDVITLTQRVRDASCDNPIAKYVFIYDQLNPNLNTQKVSKITYKNAVRNIENMLLKLGCSVSLSTRRVRKKGLNEHYRNVKTHFKTYKKAGQHSAQTFFKSYFNTEHIEIAQKMGRALSVMADYFLRDVTEQVIILENKPDGSKRTPNGYCTQNSDTKVVNIFKSANKKLRDTQNTQVKQCADFGACLWCEKYRCVADAEHVWRLLSYRDHILLDMKASAGEFQTETLQIEYINHLTKRVNDVLSELKELNPKSILDGEVHFKNNGIHPDWELSSTI